MVEGACDPGQWRICRGRRRIRAVDATERAQPNTQAQVPQGMPIVLCVLLVLSLIGSLTLLVASVWPGLLTDAAMLLVITSCIWIPLGAIITIVLLWRLFRRSARLAGRECVRPWGFAAVVLLSTLALLVLRVPMRIAFAVARVNRAPDRTFYIDE